MKSVKKFTKKYLKIIIILVILWIVVSVFSGNDSKEKEENTAQEKTVELFSINESISLPLQNICSIESIESPSVLAESSGRVNQVLINDNDVAITGQTLFVLDNVDQSIAAQEARIEVQKAQTILDELIKDNSQGSEGARLQVVTTQQDQAVETALSNFLNNDLRAYPLADSNSFDSQGSAPTISGNYTCEAEGEYVIELYNSGADSGSTFRVRGLESGKEEVTTNFSVPLGTCGLEITFPEDFQETRDWVVQIPNKRSSSYVVAKNAYENALASRDVALEQTEVSPEQITQARQRLEQSQLRFASAQNRLSKTFIKAPISGTVIETGLDVGDFVSNGQTVASIRNVDQLQAITFITEDEKKYINEDTEADIDGFEGIIYNVGSILLQTAQKIKVEILLPEKTTLTEGDSVQCTLSRVTESEDSNNDTSTIPLSAISVIGTDTYVYVIEDEMIIKRVQVTTGSLLGDSIVVMGGIENISEIIKDARGIRDGQKAIILK